MSIKLCKKNTIRLITWAWYSWYLLWKLFLMKLSLKWKHTLKIDRTTFTKQKLLRCQNGNKSFSHMLFIYKSTFVLLLNRIFVIVNNLQKYFALKVIWKSLIVSFTLVKNLLSKKTFGHKSSWIPHVCIHTAETPYIIM